jgi:PAS domain S-box-containing protein
MTQEYVWGRVHALVELQVERAAIPEYEDQRLEALNNLELLDTPAEPGFDRLTRLVKTHFNVPMVFVGLVDKDRVWVKSKIGFPDLECPRDESLCGHTILEGDILCVPDLTNDPRFSEDGPETDGRKIRFFAGIPLTVDSGFNVGCLCILDWEPRTLSFDEYEAFKDFAQCVEQQLRQSKLSQDGRFLVSQTSRLNTLLETVADGIVTIDSKGNIESVNTTGAHIFGYEPYELAGENFNELMPDLGKGGWDGYVRLCLSDTQDPSQRPNLELKGRKKNGLLFPMDMRVRKMNLEGEFLYTGIIRDITERKATENEIRLGREILEVTKENIPVGLTVFDENRKLRIANSHAGDLLSLPSELLEIGACYADIIRFLMARGDFGDWTEEAKQSNLASILEDPKLQRFVHNSENGKYIEISSRSMPGGGFVSCYSDLTSRLRNEEKLENALTQANQANQAKTNFLSTISHEIRTPLNGVIGVSQMLGDTKLDADQQEKLDAILRSGNTLLELINDVLDMNKIESGNLEIEYIECDLRETIKSIETPFQLQAQDKGVFYKCDYQDDVFNRVIIDPTRLRQILMNLLSNALKFTDKGHVTLEVKTGEKLADGKTELVLAVKDTGVGIPDDRQEQIFESFSQADSSVSRKFGGTGLGLSIVKNLIMLLGGRISLTSVVDEGSCFTVFLPVETLEKLDVVAPQGGLVGLADNLMSPLHVLVAEDNDVNAMITEAFLKKLGHTSVVAGNGAIALDRFSADLYDLVLMDVHMPEMDGLEATRQIRRREDGKIVPIIGLTAEAFTERHVALRDAGMNHVLTKPFTAKQLQDVVAKFVTQTSDQLDDEVSSSSEDVVVDAADNLFSGLPELGVGDEQKLKDLWDQLGSDVVAGLIQKTPESVLDEFEQLKDGLLNGDSSVVLRAAHTISGVSSSMCAEKLPQQASLIEKKSGSLDDIQKVLPEFEETVRETVKWWRYFLSEAATESA